MHEGHFNCTLEHAFFVTMMKLATGMTNTKLCEMYGEYSDEHICCTYFHTIGILDSKAEGMIHGTKHGG
jgi:hypothetical protein